LSPGRRLRPVPAGAPLTAASSCCTTSWTSIS